MKIKNVITHVITADLEVPFKFSQGYCYQRSSVIVEVVGADGTSGFGECMCHGQQPPQLAAAFIDHCYKDLVIGELQNIMDTVSEEEMLAYRRNLKALG